MSENAPSYRAELVGVFGHPVAENPMIIMQEEGFKAVRGLRAFNMAGINLTIPHKAAVIQFLDDLSPEAELMGAVNTVVREGDRLVGHNTDGKGFVRSVREEAGVDPRG